MQLYLMSCVFTGFMCEFDPVTRCIICLQIVEVPFSVAETVLDKIMYVNCTCFNFVEATCGYHRFAVRKFQDMEEL